MTDQFITLNGRDTTLLLECPSQGPPLWRHWGRHISIQSPLPWLASRPVPSFSLDAPAPLAMDPLFGLGWTGPSALLAHRAGLDWAQGGAVWSTEASEHTVTAMLTDNTAQIKLVHKVRLDPQSDVVTLATELTNLGDTPLDVSWLAAGALPLPAMANQIQSFSGTYAQEFQPHSDRLSRSGWRRESRQGLTGHSSPPMATILGDGATADAGPVWSAQLAWSGNHVQSVDWLADGRWLWMAGAWLAPGEARLAPGHTLATPEWLATFSPKGWNGTAQNFHKALRARSPFNETSPPRPVHLNTWEAVYFQHDEADLKDLATAAAGLGVERFVLDDGWFRGRRDDTTSLGDWQADPAIFPNGLGPLAEHVVDHGMEFGLWVEPEMVSPNSDLYRAHPDWALHLEERPRQTARNQLVLNLSHPDVSTYLYGALDALLSTLPIRYLKWDHNRILSEAGADGRPAYGAQIRALYQLIDRIRSTHPDVEIEACAAGGGRIDAGLLTRTHRVWTSDSMDAVTRVGLQRGALQFIPPEVMGSHIGAARAHITGRTQSLDFRAGVAANGHFGLELDPRTLSDGARDKITSWIALYKRLRERLHHQPVWQGDAGDGCVWQAHGDASDFILFIYRLSPSTQSAPPSVKLPFADKDALYQLRRIDPGPRFEAHGQMRALATLNSGALEMNGGWLAELGCPQPLMPAESCLILEGRRL